ncbi:MAG TPA: FAD-binding oxidoreductase [Caulobacteraceae bacterium]|nr:FAD-binding oxidoreductase [Caulobacteraceae bacterium]
MKRRDLLGAGLALAGAAAMPAIPAWAAAPGRVRPGMPGWPTDADWAALNRATDGRLSPVTPPPKLDGAEAKALLSNPFYLGDQPGLTESSGFLDGWRSSPSAYVVAAQSPADIAAAVRFAGAHNLRLVVKGRGHSYLGGSNAPDSLLVWTRHMDGVSVHDAFVPQGSSAPPVPAVSAQAGAMWLHAYQAVTGGAGRYVQGGGCTTVGVAGLVQGGGFGSFSKAFGTAAASLLEAEIVTADGKIRTVNAVQEPDLFWALKGGGGGTFGVITRLTLATHELPATFGAVSLSLHARSTEAYHRLLARFVDLYATSLCNPHWGEQARAGPDNRLAVSMVFQGLKPDEARAAWKPLIDFASANPADYEGQASLNVIALPARMFWNAEVLGHVPGVIASDPRPGAAATDFWWAGNTDEAGAFWHGYKSAWMPKGLLEPANQAGLVDAWLAASRHWSVSFHFNKGLAGAPDAALAAAGDTATNPDALSAFALAIIAMDGPSLYAGASASLADARADASRITAAMTALRAAAPQSGAYVNECDYFQENWQTAFWGPHYPRLARIKRRYDPDGLFTVHHGVGSEAWSPDGFTRSGV